MNVTEAVTSRRSIRAFEDKPVDQALLRQILETAQRSPSGGNTQPWNAVMLTGEPLTALFAKVASRSGVRGLVCPCKHRQSGREQGRSGNQ